VWGACVVGLNLARCAVARAKLAWDTGLRSITKVTTDLLGNVDYVIVEIVESSKTARELFRISLRELLVSHKNRLLVIPAQSPHQATTAQVKSVRALRD